MWHVVSESLSTKKQKLYFIRNGARVSFRTVIESWQHDRDFLDLFIDTLANCAFPAFFWETPALTRPTIDQEFECVLVDSPQLAGVSANIIPFRHYLDSCNEYAIAFSNLGNDAILVIPCYRTGIEVYSHIATFSRQAPVDQQHALWQRVGKTLTNRLGSSSVWTSTSGLGVYWMHIRLDSSPKYYTHTPYRKPA